MSWLRSSPLRQSLTRNGNSSQLALDATTTTTTTMISSIGTAAGSGSNTLQQQRSIDTAADCDPRACYDSFCKHWQQAFDIIQRSGSQKPPTHDDVLGVVSHLDYMVTLLLVELHHCNKISLPLLNGAIPPAPCLEFLLSENLLDKLYEWGVSTGRYANAVRLEQLKLYELLVSHSRHQLLCHEPFLRPLLKILASSQGEIFPPDLEKRLVILLNQLCVVLMQNVHLLDLFFFTSEQHKQESQNFTSSNFIIFSLLIPYVHREGSIGHQARDALLLCMALSQKNSNIGTYIAQYSSMCPLLVTGLGGLYSRLPNAIEITSVDWHRITPDDVTDIPELTLFMNALEFCNAVVQVAHVLIKDQLLDFMYQGFIVPVLGPAVLQKFKGKLLQTNIESQISAMSYLDLILRSITEPGLLRAFVKFLLDEEKFDGQRILDTLIDRLSCTDPNLCMVTMALFDTLLSLHCEDLMLELLLKYLLPGKHVPISSRHKINKIDPYINSAEFFLELTPDVMKRANDLTKHKHIGETIGSTHVTPPTIPSPTSTMSKTIGANWNYYGLHTGDSLYSNFYAYLFEAHYKIVQCQKACKKWANSYKYEKWPHKHSSSSRSNGLALEMVKQFFNEFGVSPLNTLTTTITSGFMNSTTTNVESNLGDGDKNNKFDSLQSIGESSGYESFKWRPDDDSESPTNVTNTQNVLEIESAIEGVSGNLSTNRQQPWRTSSQRELVITDLDFSEDLFAQGTVSLGPFLNAIWGKLQTFTSNTLYVNFHLTGLITRLAWYPLPLIHSILLRPDIMITSDTPSFHQVLRILKQQIDAELPVTEDSLEIIDVARSHLIDREFRLINVRKATNDARSYLLQNSQLQNQNQLNVTTTAATATTQQRFGQQTTFANISSTSPVQVTPSSSYDPFKRNDNKRKSISKSLTSMFSRKTNGSTFTNSSNASPPVSQSVSIGIIGNSSHNSLNSSQSSVSLSSTSTTLPMTSIQMRDSTNNLSNNLAASTDVRGGRSSSVAPQPSSSSSSTVFAANQSQNSNNGQIIISSLTPMPSASNNSSTMNPAAAAAAAAAAAGGSSEPHSLDSLSSMSSSMGAIASTSGTERTRDLALCAVLLDEWLKELAAISQEQSIIMINDNL